MSLASLLQRGQRGKLKGIWGVAWKNKSSGGTGKKMMKRGAESEEMKMET